MNRPPVNAWRSLAVAASVIGLRENATAIAVPRSTRTWSTSPRAVAGRTGSWFVSAVQMPLYPGGLQLGRLVGECLEVAAEVGAEPSVDLHPEN